MSGTLKCPQGGRHLHRSKKIRNIICCGDAGDAGDAGDGGRPSHRSVIGFRIFALSRWRLCQGLLEVGEEVINVLDPDAEAAEIIINPECGAGGWGDGCVGHDGGMFDE